MLIVGEVRTALLQHSSRLTPRGSAELLSFRPGRQVSAFDRPVNRTASPPCPTAVDCPLATEPKGRARGIGTVSTTAFLVEGTVVQASAQARLRWTGSRERQAWSHYTRQRGTVEVLHDPTPAQVLAGLRADEPDDALDLGSIAQHMVNLVQGRPHLDHRVRLRCRPTRLRWTVAGEQGAQPDLKLHIVEGVVYAAELAVPVELAAEAVEFCEDLALHDWLFTTVRSAIEQAERRRETGQDVVPVLDAALSLLVRLWHPGARVARELRGLWTQLERDMRYSDSWAGDVGWIRDQVNLQQIEVARAMLAK